MLLNDLSKRFSKNTTGFASGKELEKSIEKRIPIWQGVQTDTGLRYRLKVLVGLKIALLLLHHFLLVIAWILMLGIRKPVTNTVHT